MAKQAVNDVKQGTLPGVQRPMKVQLTADNAPIYMAKFLEEIRDEFRKMNMLLEKMNRG